MPAIHASLSDDDFIEFAALSKAKGMTRSEFASALISAEIHRASNVISEIRKTKDGIPMTTKDGTPIVPQYERQ